MLNSNEIGKFININREKRSFSQEQLGKALGISKVAVSKWESGQSLPALKYACALSMLFGTTIDDLLNANYDSVSNLEVCYKIANYAKYIENSNGYIFKEFSPINKIEETIYEYVKANKKFVELLKKAIYQTLKKEEIEEYNFLQKALKCIFQYFPEKTVIFQNEEEREEHYKKDSILSLGNCFTIEPFVVTEKTISIKEFIDRKSDFPDRCIKFVEEDGIIMKVVINKFFEYPMEYSNIIKIREIMISKVGKEVVNDEDEFEFVFLRHIRKLTIDRQNILQVFENKKDLLKNYLETIPVFERDLVLDSYFYYKNQTKENQNDEFKLTDQNDEVLLIILESGAAFIDDERQIKKFARNIDCTQKEYSEIRDVEKAKNILEFLKMKNATKQTE